MARTKLLTPNFNMPKRADGYYEIRYTVGGQRFKEPTGSKDPKEAEKFRERFARNYGKPKLSERPTVHDVCAAYVAYRAPMIVTGDKLHYLLRPIQKHLGALYAEDLTQTNINTYPVLRGADKTMRSGGKEWSDIPPSAATMDKELRMLRAALNWCLSEKLISRLPTYRIELDAGQGRVDWRTKDEMKLLMEKAKPHLALFMLLAVSTAKRREAILSLKWEGVKLYLPGHESIDFGSDVGKKRRGETTIAGNGKLIEALKAAKEVATSEYVIEWKGNRIADIQGTLDTACRDAGIKTFGAHTLKHTSITWMVQSGMSYERISKAANTTKEIIERVYGHHNPEFLADVASAVSF